jgi:hypothetical protein
MDSTTTAVISVFTAIIGVAIVAVILSPKASTSSVLSAATSGFAQDLQVAVSPITGGSFTSNILNGTNTMSNSTLNNFGI